MCHYCGYSQPLPQHCPQCGGIYSFVGLGTQKVEEELQRLFPGVSVMRMDTDTVSGVQGHAKLLAQFREEKIPVLVGVPGGENPGAGGHPDGGQGAGL